MVTVFVEDKKFGFDEKVELSDLNDIARKIGIKRYIIRRNDNYESVYLSDFPCKYDVKLIAYVPPQTKIIYGNIGDMKVVILYDDFILPIVCICDGNRLKYLHQYENYKIAKMMAKRIITTGKIPKNYKNNGDLYRKVLSEFGLW